MGETINKLKLAQRIQRKLRVSGTVRGSTERPRLSIFRSVKNIYAQVIDDTTGKTLVSASSVEKVAKTSMKHGGNKNAAAAIGKAVADKAIAKGVTQVAFDRNGYRYHGRVKALADAARAAGLKF
jgi:large subunit ribosomal protein L18